MNGIEIYRIIKNAIVNKGALIRLLYIRLQAMMCLRQNKNFKKGWSFYSLFYILGKFIFISKKSRIGSARFRFKRENVKYIDDIYLSQIYVRLVNIYSFILQLID